MAGPYEAPKMAKGKKMRKGRKKLTNTRIEHLDDGGHVITHEYTRKNQDEHGMFPSHEDEKSAVTSNGELMDHLSAKFGGSAKPSGKANKQEAEEEASEKEEPEDEEEES